MRVCPRTFNAGRGTDLQMKYATMKLEAEVIAYLEEVCGE